MYHVNCGLCFFLQIRSDKDINVDLAYFLTGPGATEEPFNLFIVDKRNGLIRVTDILDREKIPKYIVRRERTFITLVIKCK